MDLTELSMQVARVDERTQTMREEMHNGFHRLERSMTAHAEEDALAHKRIAELEHIVAKSKGAWKVVVGVATAIGGIVAVAYYATGVFHGG